MRSATYEKRSSLCLKKKILWFCLRYVYYQGSLEFLTYFDSKFLTFGKSRTTTATKNSMLPTYVSYDRFILQKFSGLLVKKCTRFCCLEIQWKLRVSCELTTSIKLSYALFLDGRIQSCPCHLYIVAFPYKKKSRRIHTFIFQVDRAGASSSRIRAIKEDSLAIINDDDASADESWQGGKWVTNYHVAEIGDIHFEFPHTRPGGLSFLPYQKYFLMCPFFMWMPSHPLTSLW